MRWTRRNFCWAVFAAAARAQTLAHPGWRGNGIVAEAWWRRAAIVQFPAETTFAQAMAAMDAMSAAGVDTLLLPDLEPVTGNPLPFAERFGSEEDLDALLREASARRMHVLLAAPLLRLAGNSGEVRFWLTRGIAGFDVGAVKPSETDALRLLRTAMDRFSGQRILLARSDTPLQHLHGGPVLQVLRAGETKGKPFVLDLAAALTRIPKNAIPMVNAPSIMDTTQHAQVRRILQQRAIR